MSAEAPDNVMQDSAEALADDGPLARHVSGFRARDAQQRMATAVEGALSGHGRLVVEAGTGTGKTFAYLVPAILSARKLIVSTGTKNLQEQLFFKDLPVVREALGRPLRSALLKGRANYLCLHRLDMAESGERFPRPQQVRELRAIRDWSVRTDSGDVSEVEAVREDSPVWGRVTSTADNCLGSECPRFADCFVIKARRRAQETDLLIINHHLLMADLSLREEGFGEILPGVDGVVIDEAHQLPHVASQFFGSSVSGRQLLDLVRDARAEYAQTAGDMPELEAVLADLEAETERTDRILGEQTFRLPWGEALERPAMRDAVDGLRQALDATAGALGDVAERARGLDQCHRRAEALRQTLALMESQETATAEADDPEEEATPEVIRWMENFRRGYVFHATPMDIGPLFQRVFGEPRSWVFTSATLAVNGRFEHFCDNIGLHDAETLALESPFDYRNNARLWLPRNLPSPNGPRFTESMLEALRPVMDATPGGIFLLFTSYRALHEAEHWLRAHSRRPLLVHGEQSRGELLRRFRDHGDSILLGTHSFWEGVDVRGGALSLVVIDRLPFKHPSDPVLKARLEALERRGLSPFMHYQLPQAVIALKQGAGRLIRDYDDRGVLVLCDPRLTEKRYGRVFLNSLPDMPVVRDRDAIVAFFNELERQS